MVLILHEKLNFVLIPQVLLERSEESFGQIRPLCQMGR